MKPSEDLNQQKLFCQFLTQNNISLSNDILGMLYQYADFVVETKEFGNLISSKDSEKFLLRHIADSLIPYIYSVNSLIDTQNSWNNLHHHNASTIKWADMGAGAGCPIFPLAIVMPKIQFYAIEPRNMRVKFMQMVKEKLQLNNLTVIGKRFETSGLSDLDFISCRALSTFENDWERAQVALKKNGVFVTLKSFNNIVHLEKNPQVHIYKYVLPGEEQVYALVTRGNE